MAYLEPDIDSGIASVSPICGCTGGCVYCYIDIKEYSMPQTNDMGCSQTMNFLLNNNNFVVGKNGTFICIGTWGEVFPSNGMLKKESLKWIKELALLENPIVLITKKTLDKKEIEKIEAFQKYDEQITFLISVTSLKKWKEMEPGTSSARDRLDMGGVISAKKMNVAVFINPYLKSITDLELDSILQICEEKKIQNVIVSPLYLNAIISNKKNACPAFQHIIDTFYDNDFINCNHMKNDEYEVIEDPIDEHMEDIISKCRCRDLKCWFHYSCFLSNEYKRINYAQYGKKYCMGCGNCLP